MALSEIEKLERRYAENPQGLTFAPLAEVHRKNGEVQRALDLLGPGLSLHPDYIPASIVLGRCHLDLGDLPAAEAAFGHVLSLDGENVIALKALADVAERQHHFDRAEGWLTTLLAVDRSNREVAYLYNASDPAVLRLIQLTLAAATKRKVPALVCGQMSASPLYTMLLLGLGMRHLSVPPSAILELKKVCRSVSVSRCEAVAARALAMDNAGDIKRYLREELRKVVPELAG